MNGFRYKFYRFMEGRYGLRALQDPMQILIYAVYLLLVLIQFFTRIRIISLLELLLIGVTLFRVLSKNIPAREREASAMFTFYCKVRDAFRFRKANAEARRQKRAVQKERRKDKAHIYRECPSCGATLRLPRKKGKHTVLCPRCGNKFGVKC